MATQSVSDLPSERLDVYRTERLAKLVKLLDMEDARRLILAYRYFPDELAGDLVMIENALRSNDRRGIGELFRWYGLKNWTVANGKSTESIDKGKSNLPICRGWARQKAMEVAAARSEAPSGIPDDDIPF